MDRHDPRAARPQRAARRWAWALVAARPLTFVAAQAAIAGVWALGGAAEPWWASAAWWPIAATLANVAGFALLRARATAERVPLRGLLFGPGYPPRERLAVLAAGALVVAIALWSPWAWGLVVWGDSGVGAVVLASPLPTWAAVVALVALPAGMAVVDLPTYAYALARLPGGALATVALGAAMGLQYVVLPFLPAWTFVEWRGLTFVPYGLAVVGLLHWRPGWLPGLAAAHGIVHAVAAVRVWLASI